MYIENKLKRLVASALISALLIFMFLLAKALTYRLGTDIEGFFNNLIANFDIFIPTLVVAWIVSTFLFWKHSVLGNKKKSGS